MHRSLFFFSKFNMRTIFMKAILLTLLSVIINPIEMIQGQQVPCAFFFGDSQFDNGNNNNLITQAKVNYQPYGIDYPGGSPTGRFANGKNIADFIAEFLGFTAPIPPYANTSGSNITKGVNYASGAAGILPETGLINQGGRISLDRQLLNHDLFISRLPFAILRFTGYFSKCLYTVNIGSNDYLNNYLLPQFYPSSILYTPNQFADKLIQKYSLQLTTLYLKGARKIAVFGIGLLGCLPQELLLFPPSGTACVDFINGYVKLFNDKLAPLINKLNNDLPGAKFTFINITSISQGDPSVAGFTNFNQACCQVQQPSGLCVPNSVPCSNRNQYLFWDNFHPTSLLNFITALKAYNATVPTDSFPFDIRNLALQ